MSCPCLNAAECKRWEAGRGPGNEATILALTQSFSHIDHRLVGHVVKSVISKHMCKHQKPGHFSSSSGCLNPKIISDTLV